MKVFDNFNDFYGWYYNELKSKIPDFEQLSRQYASSMLALTEKKDLPFLEALQEQFKMEMSMWKLSQSLPALTQEEWSYLKRICNSIQKIPNDVHLIYGRNTVSMGGRDDTFFSFFNRFTKRIEMALPTLAYYFTAFPTMLRAGLVHELGHILKRDIFVESDEAHQRCINIAMDLRINAGIDSDNIRQLSKCLMFLPPEFPLDKVKAPLPENMFSEIGLSVKEGTYTWDLIHDHIHLKDESRDKPNKQQEDLLKQAKNLQQEIEKIKTGKKIPPFPSMGGMQPPQQTIQVGSFVKSKKTGKLGRIIGVNPDGTFKIMEMDRQRVIDEGSKMLS